MTPPLLSLMKCDGEEIQTMRAFAYHAPASLAEAVALLRREGPGGRVLAGGTDLLVQMKERGVVPRYVLSLRAVADLSHVSFKAGRGLVIGSRASLTDVITNPIVVERYPILVESAGLVGSHQIQNLGTVGGNLCNAAPSADTAPPLIALGAILHLHSDQGERELPISDFFVGPGRTALGEGELLAEISVPEPHPRSGGAYERYTPRQEMDIAVASVASFVTLAADGSVAGVRIILGAVGPTPLQAHVAEAVLIGKRPTADVIEAAAIAAVSDSRPISDQRGSETYRKHLINVLARRTLTRAVASAQG